MRRSSRDFVVVGLLWAALTIVGEALALNAKLNPQAYAREARVVDGAFDLLLVLAVPVLTLVIAVLGYALWRFRRRGEPREDGPPIRGSIPVTIIWLLVTTVLAVYVIINPGLTGLAELWAHHEADLVVKVEGSRWAWRITYPEHNIVASRLVLPLNKRVRFEVTATDVLHSFWVPAFRMKIDAVPGMVTTVHATPDRTGTFEQDDTLRLQCTELCGLLHEIMTSPVSVLEQGEFEAWIAQQKAGR